MEKRNSLDIIKKEMLETIFIYFFLYLSNKVVMALQILLTLWFNDFILSCASFCIKDSTSFIVQNRDCTSVQLPFKN
jgi:hypothetical protein